MEKNNKELSKSEKLSKVKTLIEDARKELEINPENPLADQLIAICESTLETAREIQHLLTELNIGYDNALDALKNLEDKLDNKINKFFEDVAPLEEEVRLVREEMADILKQIEELIPEIEKIKQLADSAETALVRLEEINTNVTQVEQRIKEMLDMIDIDTLEDRIRTILGKFEVDLNKLIDGAREEVMKLLEQLEDAVNLLKTTKDEAIQAINDAKEEAEDFINSTKESAKQEITQTKDSAISAVNSAKDSAISSVNSAKSSAISAIQSQQSSSVSAVDRKGDEKIQEIEDLMGSIAAGDKKCITIKTIFGEGGVDLTIWQEVVMRNGEIYKYGSFFTQGLNSYSIVGIGGGGSTPVKLPLPSEVEFDALYVCDCTFHARPKRGQSNKAGISGSLDNYIFSFGNGNEGQLGNGRTGVVYPQSAEKHQFQSRVKKIVFPSEFAARMNISSVALLEDGSVYGCGKNSFGCLGLGNTTQVNSWTRLRTGVRDIFNGYPALFLVDNSGGSVYACGANELGNLGISSSTVTVTTPTICRDMGSNPNPSFAQEVSSDRFYNGATVWAVTLMRTGLGAYGAGSNNHKQISTASKATEDDMSFIRSSVSSIAATENTVFYISGNSLYSSGNGGYGYGNSAAAGDNNNMFIKSFDNSSYKVFAPRLAYGDGTGAYQIFVYSEQDQRIFAFGQNVNGNLGIGENDGLFREIKELSVPKAEFQFEVGFMRYRSSGACLLVVADGVLYTTGSNGSGRIPIVARTLSPMARPS